MVFGNFSTKSFITGLIVIGILFSTLYLLLFSLKLIHLGPEVILLAGLLLGFFSGLFVTGKSSKTDYNSETPEIKTLYVGNLSFKTSRNELRHLFEEYGDVHAARIMVDKATRKPRGYGFVEMESKDAKIAMDKLNGSEFAGRYIKVTEANEKNG